MKDAIGFRLISAQSMYKNGSEYLTLTLRMRETNVKVTIQPERGGDLWIKTKKFKKKVE